MGDGLSTGRGDLDLEGRPVGWTRRLETLLAERTGVPYTFTNLAQEGATLAPILTEQVPVACRARPDLVTITAGVNDISGNFAPEDFHRQLEAIFARLAETRATIVTMTFPDLSSKLPLNASLRGLARELLEQANHAIRSAAKVHSVLYVNAWHATEVADEAFWCEDDLYPSAYGHQVIARAFADLLVSSRLVEPPREMIPIDSRLLG
jgi:lysophospholipase L1-like esterase